MFQLIDTLYITETEAQLWAQDGCIVIQLPDGVKTQIPSDNLSSIICFDFPSLHSSVLRFFAEKSIRVYMIRSYGEAMIEIGETVQFGSLWQIQQEFSQDEVKQMDVAKHIMLGRALNCRGILQKAVHDNRDLISHKVLIAAGQIQSCCKAIETEHSMPLLIESGRKADEIYTACLPELILSQKQDFIDYDGDRAFCSGRFTTLSSFLYTLLTFDITVALEACGLNPSCGFLHQEANSRNGLALDLLGELSPCLADRMAFSLINQKQVRPTDFIPEASGHVRITEDAKRNIISSWQNRKQETLNHPYLNTKIATGMIAHVQGVLLTRYLRGELDGYPPFIFG